MIFEIIPVFYGIPPNSSDSIRGITFAFSHGVFARALEKAVAIHWQLAVRPQAFSCQGIKDMLMFCKIPDDIRVVLHFRTTSLPAH